MARIEPSRPQATAQVLQKNQALVKAPAGKAIQSAKTEAKQASYTSASKGTRVDIRA
jgi:hypothetical protein